MEQYHIHHRNRAVERLAALEEMTICSLEHFTLYTLTSMFTHFHCQIQTLGGTEFYLTFGESKALLFVHSRPLIFFFFFLVEGRKRKNLNFSKEGWVSMHARTHTHACTHTHYTWCKNRTENGKC